jgi:hypothetical protein
LLNRVLKWLDDINWDRLGIGLSFLCAVHCLVTPLVLISLPILARYYVSHPLFHLLLALAIVPVGFLAFLSGFRHHATPWALVLGIPGLLLVATVPYFAHVLFWNINETVLMILGSGLLITAHLLNRRACRSCAHHGKKKASDPLSKSPAKSHARLRPVELTTDLSAMQGSVNRSVTVSNTELSQ